MPQGLRITTHVADVSDEAQVLRFRDEVADAARHRQDPPAVQQRRHRRRRQHGRRQPRGVGADLQHLLGRRLPLHARLPADAAERPTRATSSTPAASTASGRRLGPRIPHTAYCAAKFAVKGFTEALITDLRINAPHIKCSVVMPGHIGTSIVTNSRKIQSGNDSDALTARRSRRRARASPRAAG